MHVIASSAADERPGGEAFASPTRRWPKGAAWVAACVGLAWAAGFTGAMRSCGAAELDLAASRAELVAKARVVEIAARCTVIGCDDRKYRIESQRVFFRRDPSVVDADISVLLVCGSLDLELGKSYVFFLDKSTPGASPRQTVDDQAVEIRRDSPCSHDVRAGGVFLAAEDDVYYRLIDRLNEPPQYPAVLVAGVRETGLGEFLQRLSEQQKLAEPRRSP